MLFTYGKSKAGINLEKILEECLKTSQDSQLRRKVSSKYQNFCLLIKEFENITIRNNKTRVISRRRLVELFECKVKAFLQSTDHLVLQIPTEDREKVISHFRSTMWGQYRNFKRAYFTAPQQ